jgi:hypothetical protein
MIKEKSRDLCSIQQLMDEMLKESHLSDDSRIIEPRMIYFYGSLLSLTLPESHFESESERHSGV